MSFIEEIQPHIERIKLHQKGGRITNLEILREIRDIHFKYIRSKDFDTPSNLGCNHCVRQMINQLVGEIGRQEKAIADNESYIMGDNLEDEIFPELKSEKMTFPNHEKHPKRWGAFKKYCTSKGIKVKGKKRTDLENELKGL